jgi:hypothetical protein
MSSAFRAALFSGREWGKPQARFDFGEAADDDPAKTSRGKDGACLKHETSS